MKSLYLLLFAIIVIIASCKKDNHSGCTSAPVAADKYIYPVLAGSVAWNAAGTWGIGKPDPLDSIYKLCQIPVDKLQTMSTLGLIQSLEENPCLFNMFLKDNWLQGRNEVLPRLNVSWALNKRADAGLTLIEHYKAKSPDIVSCMNSDLEKGRYANNWYLLDMICTQDSLLTQLNTENKKRFAEIILEKFDAQLKYPNTFGTEKTPMIFILSQMMVIDAYLPYLNLLMSEPVLKNFSITGDYGNDYTYVNAKVLELSKKFVNG